MTTFASAGNPSRLHLGAAAYQRWKTDETVNNKLNSYCSEKYEKTLGLKGPKLNPIESSGSEEADTSNDNSDDPDWRAGMPGPTHLAGGPLTRLLIPR